MQSRRSARFCSIERLPMPDSSPQNCKRELQVEIPADVVARETETVLNKYQKLARLPGFRRGKVPVSILRQRFSSEIQTDVVESLVPRYFREEAKKQGLTPVSQPRVTDLQVHEGEPLRFKAEFEVLPEISISGYENLRVAKPEVAVTDDEVQAALDRLREQQATYTTVDEDRPLADGDFAQVSLSGTPKNSPADIEAEAEAPKPVHMDEVLVEVGGTNTVREFSENLRGARSSEERTFEVAYPDDFSDKRLAGKRFDYTLKILGIKRKTVPELNDDFAKEVSNEFQTLDALRTRIREGMIDEKQHEVEHQAKEQIVDELVKQHEFAVPESLIDHQIDLRLERGLRALAAQGMRTEDMRKMDFPRLRSGQRDAATREVKSSLILDKIAEQEKIEVTDEELDREIQQIATQARQPVEAIRARLDKEGGLDRVRARMRNEKTLDFLYRKSA